MCLWRRNGVGRRFAIVDTGQRNAHTRKNTIIMVGTYTRRPWVYSSCRLWSCMCVSREGVCVSAYCVIASREWDRRARETSVASDTIAGRNVVGTSRCRRRSDENGVALFSRYYFNIYKSPRAIHNIVIVYGSCLRFSSLDVRHTAIVVVDGSFFFSLLPTCHFCVVPTVWRARL